MNLSRLYRLTRTDTQSPHRCPGYIREEITLATTTVDSAVVAHDTPSPQEICSICNEVVGFYELFRCVCGARAPGSQHTIKCQVCKRWSHSACVKMQKDFICLRCTGGDGRTAHFRTWLNNIGQAKGFGISYTCSRTGPQNSLLWSSVALVNNMEYGRGIGSTQGSAKERAAKQALVALGATS
ncbi:hypothetical protein K438DRAFT_1813372 [Mycena galopus ATCC 62051]|nr:hypothetical protein K438DRAFT_1813372 [Mycena galopus ATCC 62051]